MTLVALGLLLVALIQMLCLFALVDQYKSLLQIRDALRLVDTSYDLPLFAVDGTLPSAIGLPSPIDREPFAVVLLLSTKCSSCRSVALAMDGRLPDDSWIVLEGRSEDECREFQEQVRLSTEPVFVDAGGRIAERLRIHHFPSAIVFANGQAQSAHSVPSYRQFRQLLERRKEAFPELDSASRGG